MKRILTYRKAQEEIVGFVLIMVIVAIAFLIFLGFSLRKGEVSHTDSREIAQFLESSMEYTTDCSVRFSTEVVNLGELFEDCFSGSSCLSGEDTCEALARTMRTLLDASWQVGDDSPVKAYSFTAVYSRSRDQPPQEIITLEKNECTGRTQGSSSILPAFPGVIRSTLELCF